jgi:site-specific DNA-adenine methylase
MRYGLPYKGSKNQIAEWVIENLPSGGTFVDMFCGGCAVTHAALLSGRWERYIINDIDGRMPKLFLDAIHGKYTPENCSEWISREEFHRRKDEDAFVAICWSFANNGVDYIYGKNVETFKEALHYACFANDTSKLEALGFHVEKSDKPSVAERIADYRNQLNANTLCMDLNGAERLEDVERIQNFERLQSLANLQSLASDFSQVRIPGGAVIYCDPPYFGTNCGKYAGFDSERFHEWARVQDNIFISEYQMPDDFVVVAEKEKIVLAGAADNRKTAVERIWTNRRTWDAMSNGRQRMYLSGLAQQMSLF